MSRVFSREEFYELVWSKPMTHLAKEFALSDVALHKICRKHDIPNPPLGWWAKKAAGKQVTQTPLPRARKDITDRIVIAGGELRNESEAVTTIREQARVRASCAPAVEAQPRHPLVERTIVRLRKVKSGATGLASVEAAGLIKCEIAPSSIDRLGGILDGIVAAAARQGFQLVAEESAAWFVGEESVAFSVVETVKRVKHELTDKERAEEEKWSRKRERVRPRNEWDDIFFSRPRFPEWDHHPTGQLSFEFEHVYVWGGSSLRRSFRDAKIQRLENLASDIAVGLVVLAAAKKAERLRREEEERRAEEQRRLRALALRAQHIEERRVAMFDNILEELEQVDRLRRLLGALREMDDAAGEPRLAEFTRWAAGHLASREAAVAAEGLARRFEEQRLFGEDDDHAFRSPHWH